MWIGEDSVASDQTGFAMFINITDLDSAIGTGLEEPMVVPENRHCKADDPIDCRDPDLFHLLMRATIEKFKDIHFYRFGKPVRGDNDSSCHMAWRYRPNEGKAAAFNKDYRSFTVARSENCTVSVVGIGEYHSGGNARKRKGKGKGTGTAKEVFDKMPARAEDNNPSALPEVGETVNAFNFRSSNQRVCLVVASEAQYLNRTLVMDLSVCLSKIYSSSGVDEEGKDFRFYFDLEHLKDSASVLDQSQFWSGWTKWQEKDRLSLHLVEDFRVTPMKLAEVKDSLIMRKFGSVEPDNYWYRVCEGETESVVQRPWHMIRKSRRLLDVASGITSRMNWDFDGVRVERGEKAKNTKLWPNLDKDTSPKALMAILRDKIEDGRNIYIATNERGVSFFDPLKEKYSTHFLDEYKDLWDVNSDWYDETTKLNNGNAVEFDGYMRMSVDTEVFLKGKKQIETFNDLTKDCKDGINRC
ncbi:hypothetical protein DH2020_024984 [Rehmannia glutinosa]|uniref:Uncharacterized protein n=1 Tax=Rehmannia glutinosa TaxID=99300 RepID=A0ABR0W0Z0_REHGL